MLAAGRGEIDLQPKLCQLNAVNLVGNKWGNPIAVLGKVALLRRPRK
jgi:hypothetical protein